MRDLILAKRYQSRKAAGEVREAHKCNPNPNRGRNRNRNRNRNPNPNPNKEQVGRAGIFWA